jgi:hypothetical protein
MKVLLRPASLLSLMMVAACNTQRPPSQAALPATADPAAKFVLVGLAETKNARTAFVMNDDSQLVSQLKTGDELAGGKVVAINVDQMDFSDRGVTRHVLVGQKLTGE